MLTSIYNPTVGGPSPGELPGHITELNTFRCVFSFTVDRNGDVFRHLSISIPRDGFMPHPVAVAEIAGLFGFQRYEEGVEARLAAGAWMVNVNKQDHCIVLAEQL